MEKLPVKIKKQPKIVLSDLKEIARLVATRKLTETEACHVLDIKPENYFVFKSRNGRSEIFAKYLEKIKSNKINSLLNQIEDISDGDESIKQKPDWRAKQWLLTITSDRFAKVSEPTQTTNNLTVNLMSDALKRVFVEVEPVKQLTEVKSKIPPRKSNVV